MPGFTSPTILYLSTWDSPERAYCRSLLGKLHEGGYTTYVEPLPGGFAMPVVANASGWAPGQMHTCDVSLFASVLGTMLDPERSFADLDVKIDGQPVDLDDDDPVGSAAEILYLQLLTRMQIKPAAEYWRMLVTDLTEQAAGHRSVIHKSLAKMHERLAGLHYETMDLWDLVDRWADDPHAVICTNPPTYEGAFEKFFETDGRITWAQPSYHVWSPERDLARLQEVMEGRAALLVGQQQKPPRKATHPVPLFARNIGLGSNIYLVSNRPDDVFKYMGGPKVALTKPGEILPADCPPIGWADEITDKSVVTLLPVKASVADYYRGFWMHRLNAEPGSYNLLMLVDGKAAGVIGYSLDTLVMPYSPEIKKLHALLLRFAIGAPHETFRLTRLATLAAMQYDVARLALGPKAEFYLAASEHLVTVEMTRYPESKGLRGLMKMFNKQDHPDGYKLTYGARWGHLATPAMFAEWLKKERAWQKTRTPKGSA